MLRQTAKNYHNDNFDQDSAVPFWPRNQKILSFRYEMLAQVYRPTLPSSTSLASSPQAARLGDAGAPLARPGRGGRARRSARNGLVEQLLHGMRD
eukprot:SAG22_NODE_12287_length_448_cov_1.303725_1_plen_94_part_10